MTTTIPEKICTQTIIEILVLRNEKDMSIVSASQKKIIGMLRTMDLLEDRKEFLEKLYIEQYRIIIEFNRINRQLREVIPFDSSL